MTPWLQIAKSEAGVRAHPAGGCHPRIREYHTGTNIQGYDDKVSWCSSFVNWSLGRAGIRGTGSALARSWMDWGQALDEPVEGCVTVLWREQPSSWKGHVGFFLRADQERVYLLGGNQLDEVREHSYPIESVLCYRWPLGWPLREAPVEIADYDQNWPAKFGSELELLKPMLAPWLAGDIVHIGSTAVPGLAAKPVIDMMAPVTSLDASRPAIAALATLDYCYAPYKESEMHWFCKPSPGFRTHHLHLVPVGSPLWDERLRFRDALRNRPELAAEYAALKRELAERFRLDREAYTEAKTAFVRRVLNQA